MVRFSSKVAFVSSRKLSPGRRSLSGSLSTSLKVKVGEGVCVEGGSVGGMGEVVVVLAISIDVTGVSGDLTVE